MAEKSSRKLLFRAARVLISLMLVLEFVPGALAQENETDSGSEDRKRIIYRKKSTVDFNDAVIEGKGTNPEGIYVVTPPQRKFRGLLRLRTNFHKELIRDSLLLK